MSVYSFFSKLDKEHAKQLRDKMEEIDRRKTEYERLYYIQLDEYRLHNTRFGGNKKAIVPSEYNKLLEKELVAEAEDILRSQQEKEKEQREAQQEREEKDMDPRRGAFRQRMREMDGENKRAREKGIEYE